jgi:hypothetical protein
MQTVNTKVKNSYRHPLDYETNADTYVSYACDIGPPIDWEEAR